MDSTIEIRGWTTHGDVRGQCGHLHPTSREAMRCLERDQGACHSQGGYSDRQVCMVRADEVLVDESGAWIPGIGGRTSGAATFGGA